MITPYDSSSDASCNLEEEDDHRISFGNEREEFNETSELIFDEREFGRMKNINSIKGQAYKMQKYKSSSKSIYSRIGSEQVEWTANLQWSVTPQW